MGLIVSFLCVVLMSFSCLAQKSYRIETIAFYNLENLFDSINNPDTLDELSPIMEMKSNRSYVYKDKLERLSNVLIQIGSKKNKMPPAIVGVAEVENRKVLEDLISTKPLADYNYGIIHYDSPDQRGIDTGMLYHKDIFKPIYSETVPANIYKDGYKVDTRDILWVTGYLLDEKIHVLVNHWPSRRGGVKKSSKLREAVARTVKNTILTICEEEPDAKIVVMGDFNDNPTNKSLQKIATKEMLYNPFEKMYKKGLHSLVYKSGLFLFDQILLSPNFLPKKNSPQFRFYKAGIYNPSYLTNQSGKYKGNPKRSFGNGRYLRGYSDHYPVYTYLLKEKE